MADNTDNRNLDSELRKEPPGYRPRSLAEARGLRDGSLVLDNARRGFETVIRSELVAPPTPRVPKSKPSQEGKISKGFKPDNYGKHTKTNYLWENQLTRISKDAFDFAEGYVNGKQDPNMDHAGIMVGCKSVQSSLKALEYDIARIRKFAAAALESSRKANPSRTYQRETMQEGDITRLNGIKYVMINGRLIAEDVESSS